MADPETEPRALVVAPDRTPAPLANLARRTLATLKDPESGLTKPQFIVSADGSATFSTIGAAVALAGDGDEILVRPGEYRESLVIERSVSIRADGRRERIVVRPPSKHEPCILITGGEPHLYGLTIDGTEFNSLKPCGRGRACPPVLLKIVAGSPTVEALDVNGAHGIEIVGAGTKGAILRCIVRASNNSGIDVVQSAWPRIEENEVYGHGYDGIRIFGAGADTLVRANRVHDCVRHGINVADTSPRIEENETWGNAGFGIAIQGQAGTAPLVRANRVHDGRIGIYVGGASPRIEDNEVWRNAEEGVHIYGFGASPVITGNRIYENDDDGIHVIHGASPAISGNVIRGNGLMAIRVDDDTTPRLGPNETDG